MNLFNNKKKREAEEFRKMLLKHMREMVGPKPKFDVIILMNANSTGAFGFQLSYDDDIEPDQATRCMIAWSEIQEALSKYITHEFES